MNHGDAKSHSGSAMPATTRDDVHIFSKPQAISRRKNSSQEPVHKKIAVAIQRVPTDRHFHAFGMFVNERKPVIRDANTRTLHPAKIMGEGQVNGHGVKQH